MDLKDLDRIHKEQADRRKFGNVLRRFEEGTNVRNTFICVAIIIVLVVAIYGLNEMRFVFESSPVEQAVEQPVQEDATE